MDLGGGFLVQYKISTLCAKSLNAAYSRKNGSLLRLECKKRAKKMTNCQDCTHVLAENASLFL